MSMVLSQAESVNNNQVDLNRKIAKEVNSTVDHGSEKVELSSENIPVNDPNFNLPQTTVMNGTQPPSKVFTGLTFLTLLL